jgi:hypothetical protein
MEEYPQMPDSSDVRHRRPALAALAIAAALGSLAVPAYAQTTPPAAAAAPAQGGADQGTLIQQPALDLLKKVSDKLKAAKTISVEVRDIRQVPTSAGQMISLITEAEYDMQRPDKLRIEATVGAVDTLYLYDGSTISILDKPSKMYVSEEAPATTQEALAMLATEHGIQFGVEDFLVEDPYAVLSKDLTHAYVVGQTALDDDKTTQLVFAAPGLEYQLWVDEASSLPKLMTVTYLGLPTPAHFMVEFDDWELDGPVSADAFKFSAPEGSKKIDFLPN